MLYIWDSFFVLKTGRNFSIENQLIFTSIIFLLKTNTNFSFENQLIFNCDFVLKINEKFSIEKQLNFRITLYFLYRDFQRYFSIDFAILLKLPFYIKNQSFFYWKSIGFCQHHFFTENQYRIFYWITCTFSTCAFVLKTNTIFSIENQFIFLSIIFFLKISTNFSIECTFHFSFLFSFSFFRFFFFRFVFFFSLSFVIVFIRFYFLFFFVIAVLRQASFARRPSLYSQNEAKREKRPGNSCFFYFYFNHQPQQILSTSSCSVDLARQIELKKRDPDGFFA